MMPAERISTRSGTSPRRTTVRVSRACPVSKRTGCARFAHCIIFPQWAQSAGIASASAPGSAQRSTGIYMEPVGFVLPRRAVHGPDIAKAGRRDPYLCVGVLGRPRKDKVVQSRLAPAHPRQIIARSVRFVGFVKVGTQDGLTEVERPQRPETLRPALKLDCGAAKKHGARALHAREIARTLQSRPEHLDAALPIDRRVGRQEGSEGGWRWVG